MNFQKYCKGVACGTQAKKINSTKNVFLGIF